LTQLRNDLVELLELLGDDSTCSTDSIQHLQSINDTDGNCSSIDHIQSSLSNDNEISSDSDNDDDDIVGRRCLAPYGTDMGQHKLPLSYHNAIISDIISQIQDDEDDFEVYLETF
jgi:hypothetical protein